MSTTFGNLILHRKAGESIVIGKDITIKFLEVRRGTVKVGITAPKDVSIVRDELLKDSSVNPTK